MNVRIAIQVVLSGLFLSSFQSSSFGQSHDTSLAIPPDNHYMDPNNQGVSLIKNEKYEEANHFFSAEIKKDEANRSAYFNRGVVNWNMNNEANACRDWSALLALGDTAAFKLLDKNCHGEMVIEEDTIKSSQYHKMWEGRKNDKAATAPAMSIVDEMPQYPGGSDSLMNYIADHLRYPKHAAEKKIQGRVYVNFIISSKGKILFPYIARGISKECNAEAIRLVKSMALWKPGRQSGKAVPVRYSLPVTFSL